MATQQTGQTNPTATYTSVNRNPFIILGLVLLGITAFFGRPWFGSGNTKVETISQELVTAKQAEVFLTSGVNGLKVSAGTSTMLVEGTVELSPRERIERNSEMRGDAAMFRLVSESTTFRNFPNDTRRTWQLRLNPDIPLALTIQAGVGRVQLDLSELNVMNLELKLGLGETTVELPSTGQLEATIEAGVGETTIYIPEGVAARIEAEAGIGNVNVSGDFERVGDAYVSSDYDTAKNRIALNVTGGVGQVNVETNP